MTATCMTDHTVYHARRAVRLTMELVDLSRRSRKLIMEDVAERRGVPREDAPGVNNFSNWLKWLNDPSVQRPSPELMADVLAAIAKPLSARTGIKLTDRKRHAILTVFMRHVVPGYIALTEKRLTYRLDDVFAEVWDEVGANAHDLRRTLGVPAEMRRVMAGTDRRLREARERDRRDLASIHGLHPVADFHKLEKIRQEKEAEHEEAVRAWEEAEESSGN